MWILVFAKNPLVFVLALYWLGMLAAYAQTASLQSAINTSQRSQERMEVHYVGSFLSAKDFGPKHPILATHNSLMRMPVTNQGAGVRCSAVRDGGPAIRANDTRVKVHQALASDRRQRGPHAVRRVAGRA